MQDKTQVVIIPDLNYSGVCAVSSLTKNGTQIRIQIPPAKLEKLKPSKILSN